MLSRLPPNSAITEDAEIAARRRRRPGALPSGGSSPPRSEKPSIGVTRSMPFIMQAATEASRNSAGLKASVRPAGLVSASRADAHDLRRDRRRRACCAASRAPAGRAPDHLCAPHRHRPAPRGLSGATSVYTASPGFNADPGSRDRALHHAALMVDGEQRRCPSLAEQAQQSRHLLRRADIMGHEEDPADLAAADLPRQQPRRGR